MTEPAQLLPAIAPETADMEQSVVDTHLALAKQQTGSVFGDARNHAIALLAAHTLTLSQRGGAGGPIASEKEGNLSRSYATSNQIELSATSYGAELQRLRRQYIMGARTVKV